jgi:uncharacterized protein
MSFYNNSSLHSSHRYIHMHSTLTGVGVSLKAQHYHDILTTQPTLDWFEIHPENYMGAGGLPHKYLRDIAQHYPISMHGVGLSLGSANGVSKDHLLALKKLIDQYQPAQVSEHLSWSHWNQTFLNDLLPLPYNAESLALVTTNIHQVQDTLGRKILIENPSAYLGFQHSDMSETEFMRQIVDRTGCGLLLDINNVYVSANNQQYSTNTYLENYPLDAVGEIHLAGHVQEIINTETVLIDDHGSPVTDDVWTLFRQAIALLSHNVPVFDVPVLIEWDTDVPDFNILLAEAQKAKTILTEMGTGLHA